MTRKKANQLLGQSERQYLKPENFSDFPTNEPWLNTNFTVFYVNAAQEKQESSP